MCLANTPALQNSHIIPECLYKPIYDFKHRFIPIRSDNYSKARTEQMGYREKLLCASCENKLSRWENTTKKILVGIADQGRPSGQIVRTLLSKDWQLIENLSYDDFKKCMLSILWCLSISELEIFAAYALGPHEERLREILHDDRSLGTLEYPLMLHQVIVDGQHYPDLIMGMNKGRIDGFIQQSFIVYGFLVDIVLSAQFPRNLRCVLLSDIGTVPVRKYEFDDLPQDKNLMMRFNDSDVRKFYPPRS